MFVFKYMSEETNLRRSLKGRFGFPLGLRNRTGGPEIQVGPEGEITVEHRAQDGNRDRYTRRQTVRERALQEGLKACRRERTTGPEQRSQ